MVTDVCVAFPTLSALVEGFEVFVVTGASGRNWAAYGEHVVLGEHISASQRAVLTDPQTSGGLLVSCRPEVAPQVLEIFTRHGFNAARVIGTMQTGPAQVQVQ